MIIQNNLKKKKSSNIIKNKIKWYTVVFGGNQAKVRIYE